MRVLAWLAIFGGLMLPLSSCGDEPAKPASAGPSAEQVAAFEARFLANALDGEATPATTVRAGSGDGDAVLTAGRIDRFVDGFAVFTMVDLEVDY